MREGVLRRRGWCPGARGHEAVGHDLVRRHPGHPEVGVVLCVVRRMDVRGRRRRRHLRCHHGTSHVVLSTRGLCLVRGGDLPRLPLPPPAGRGAVLNRAVVVDERAHVALRARGAYPVRRGEGHCASDGSIGG
jgi:hypothetical protein